MYSFEQSEQVKLFLLSLGAGFFLGIIYDFLRAIRLTLSKSKAIVFIFDILYFLIFCFFTFIFFLAVNKGEFRSYMIFGELLGWIFYYLSFGIAAKSFTDIFVKVIHSVFRFIKKTVLAPFLLIFRLFLKLKDKFFRFFKKVGKKYEKNHKKHLQKFRLYVYNLLGILNRQRNVKKRKVATEMTNNKTVRRKTRKHGFIMITVFCAVAALAIYFAFSFASAKNEIDEKKALLSELQTQKEEQEKQNKELEKTIKENDEAEIAEKYARENGYVKTDERVYIDITPGT